MNPKSIQSTLERLRSIDGCIGAAGVDSESAMTLGVDGGGGVLKLEVAAAGKTDIIKAKRQTMASLGLKGEIEDILITLGRQYHFIRPVRSRPGMFFYLAIERARANLAIARMTRAECEKSIEFRNRRGRARRSARAASGVDGRVRQRP